MLGKCQQNRRDNLHLFTIALGDWPKEAFLTKMLTQCKAARLSLCILTPLQISPGLQILDVSERRSRRRSANSSISSGDPTYGGRSLPTRTCRGQNRCDAGRSVDDTVETRILAAALIILLHQTEPQFLVGVPNTSIFAGLDDATYSPCIMVRDHLDEIRDVRLPLVASTLECNKGSHSA